MFHSGPQEKHPECKCCCRRWRQGLCFLSMSPTENGDVEAKKYAEIQPKLNTEASSEDATDFPILPNLGLVFFFFF